MSRLLLQPDLLLDPEVGNSRPGALLVEDGRILGRLEAGAPNPEAFEAVPLPGLSLAPGFIDLHFHGEAIFSDAHQISASFKNDAELQARHGVTSHLVTSVAWRQDRIQGFLEAFHGWAPSSEASISRAIGVHLEGPWINPEAAGAQPKSGISHHVDPKTSEEILDAGIDAIRMVTLAPEVEGIGGLMTQLRERGIVGAIGHSLAGKREIDAAADAGMTHVTHLFNAMSGMHHRGPGLAAIALAEPRLSADLICDGLHVDPLWVRHAAALKGSKLSLISDRICPPEGGSTLGADLGMGTEAVVDDGQALRLPDGRLAGSRLGLDVALRNAIAFGAMDLVGALAACTLRPARVLGLESEIGTLRRGARADFALLDGEAQLRETWRSGRRIWRTP